MIAKIALFVALYLVIRRLLRGCRCECQCDLPELSNTTMVTIDQAQQTQRRETNEAITTIARHLKRSNAEIEDLKRADQTTDLAVSKIEAAFALQALLFVAEIQAAKELIEAELRATKVLIDAESTARNRSCYVLAKSMHNKDNKLFNQSQFMTRQEIAEMRQWFIAALPKFTQQLFNWFAHHYAYERYESDNQTQLRTRKTWTPAADCNSSPCMWTSETVWVHNTAQPCHYSSKVGDWSTNWMWYQYVATYNTYHQYQSREVKQSGWDMFMLDDKTPLPKELTKEAAEALFDAAFPSSLMLDSAGIELPVISVHTEPSPYCRGHVMAKTNQGFYVKHATVLMAHIIQHVYASSQ